MEKQTKQILPDFYLVKLPDDLSFWNNEISQWMTESSIVYLVDRNTEWHVGESNGMYACHALYLDLKFVEDAPKERYDNLLKKIDTAFAGSYITYIHVFDVNRIFDADEQHLHITDEQIARINQINKDWKKQYLAFTNEGGKRQYYNVMIDILREFYQENHGL